MKKEKTHPNTPLFSPRKLISLFLMILLIAGSIPATAFAGDIAGVSDPIVEGSAAIDVLVNAGTSSTVLASELSGPLYTKLRERLDALGLGNVTVRISTPKVGLNTADTSDWYVYDHYDAAWYANEAAWKASGAVGYGANTTLRPYFANSLNPAGNAVSGSGPNGTMTTTEITALAKNSNKIPKMTIQQWVEGPKPKTYSNDEVTLGSFEQHIYNHVDANVAYMDFVGYYTGSYSDFMLYPCTSQESKQVTFDIDSTNVNAHSLNGAGFLINAGIDSSKNLVGYYLYYAFSSTSTPASVSLYQINSNVKAADIHNAATDKTDGITSKSAITVTKAIATSSWNAQMSVRLTITPTHVLVEQKPKAGTDDYVTVINQSVADSGQKGFGPIVHYKQTGHTCVRASQFTYSNLKMAYISQSDDIFDVLSQANYLQDSEKYFIDLTDNGENRSLESGEDGTDAAAYMQAKEIRYITNHENDLVGTGSPLGSNGTTLGGEDSIAELADKIADYIASQHGKPYGTPSEEDKLPLSAPVALLSLVREKADDGKTPTKYVDIVRRDLITGELPIYFYDVKSEPSDGKTITAYHYTITYPDGRTDTFSTAVPNDKSLEMTNNATAWPLGKYSVTLTVTDSGGKTSAPVTVNFTVAGDTVAPVVSINITDSAAELTFGNPGTNSETTYISALDSYATVINTSNAKPATPAADDAAWKPVNGATSASVDFNDLNPETYYVHAFLKDAAGNIGYAMGTVTITKKPQKLEGTKKYIFEAGVDKGAKLDLIATSAAFNLGTDTLGSVTYNIKAVTNSAVSLSGDAITVGSRLGEAVIGVKAAETSSHREAAEQVTVKVVMPFTVTMAIGDYTVGTDITIIPVYLDEGNFGVSDTRELKYRKVGTEDWITVPVDEWNWNTPYTIGFSELTAGAEYEILLSGQNNRETPTKSKATLIFKVPGDSVGEGTTSIGLEETKAGEPYTVSIRAGETVLDSVVVKGNGGEVEVPAFEGLFDGFYNIVVEYDNEAVTNLIEIRDGKQIPEKLTVKVGSKSTRVKLGNAKSPNVVVDGLNSLFDAGAQVANDKGGITGDDNDAVDNRGGTALIELISTGLDEADVPDDIGLIDGIKGNQQYGMILDLSLYKKIWESGDIDGTESKLTSSSKLITVAIPLGDLRQRTNLKAYRVHGIEAWEIPGATSDGSGGYVWKEDYVLPVPAPGGTILTKGNPVGNEEFVVFTADYAVLHINKFSTYAIGYTPSSDSGSPSHSSSSSSTARTVTVGESSHGKVTSDASSQKAGSTVTITVTPDNGYALGSLSIRDSEGNLISYTKNSDGTYRFTMPSSAVTIKADFVKGTVVPTATGVADWLITGDHIRYMIGDDKGLFNPGKNMTRAEAAQMFYNLLLNKDVKNTESFSDVPAGAWYRNAVETLATLDIVTGYNGNYRANQYITRAEFTAIAMRFAAVTDGTASFSDVTGSHWAYRYIMSAAGYGWINGYSDGTYKPQALITRSEVVTIVNHMLGRSADKAYIDNNLGTLRRFPDVADSSYWAYYGIFEATNAHEHELSSGQETWTGVSE